MAAREKVNPTGGVLGVVFWYEECSTCVSWFSCDPTTVYTGGGTECVFGVLFCISADEYCVWLSVRVDAIVCDRSGLGDGDVSL